MRYASRAVLLLTGYLQAVGQHSEANWAFMKAHFQVGGVEGAERVRIGWGHQGQARKKCDPRLLLLLLLPPPQEENLRAGLMLEQAAYCLLALSSPHTRKFAFHLVLAGLRFDMCGHKGLARRAYR